MYFSPMPVLLKVNESETLECCCVHYNGAGTKKVKKLCLY